MFETSAEVVVALGGRVRARRIALGYTQVQAAERAGIAYRTWRRLEAEGKASIEDLVRAAIALRCEEGLAALFPEPAGTTMDALLQAHAQAMQRGNPPRQRASRSRQIS